MFFAANSPLLGLVNIVPQFALIVATVVVFYGLDRLAAYCLVPLTAWVAFATVLNLDLDAQPLKCTRHGQAADLEK